MPLISDDIRIVSLSAGDRACGACRGVGGAEELIPIINCMAHVVQLKTKNETKTQEGTAAKRSTLLRSGKWQKELLLVARESCNQRTSAASCPFPLSALLTWRIGNPHRPSSSPGAKCQWALLRCIHLGASVPGWLVSLCVCMCMCVCCTCVFVKAISARVRN